MSLLGIKGCNLCKSTKESHLDEKTFSQECVNNSISVGALKRHFYLIVAIVIFVCAFIAGIFLKISLQLSDSIVNIYIATVFNCQADSAFGEFVFRELRAFAGAITITCLMVCPCPTLIAISL